MRKSKMEVQLSKDIRTYTEKLLWGLSTRQCVCAVVGLGLGAVACVLVSVVGGLPLTVGTMVGFVVMIVPFALGFYQWHGQPTETLILAWVRMYMMTPRILLYRPVNPYLELLRERENRIKLEKERKETDVETKRNAD